MRNTHITLCIHLQYPITECNFQRKLHGTSRWMSGCRAPPPSPPRGRQQSLKYWNISFAQRLVSTLLLQTALPPVITLVIGKQIAYAFCCRDRISISVWMLLARGKQSWVYLIVLGLPHD